jgi:hypothetical protein
VRKTDVAGFVKKICRAILHACILLNTKQEPGLYQVEPGTICRRLWHQINHFGERRSRTVALLSTESTESCCISRDRDPCWLRTSNVLSGDYCSVYTWVRRRQSGLSCLTSRWFPLLDDRGSSWCLIHRCLGPNMMGRGVSPDSFSMVKNCTEHQPPMSVTWCCTMSATILRLLTM